ncbi:unnamed protein product, partial [Anisakis simplex]|uniref:Notch (inferred by orthology to a S. mansoni protein) n=1 Tax=Anisakis simplex TaxID=6269 RepID=A0A0M3KBZ7_ANISI
KPCKSNSECIVNTASGEFECRCRKGFTGPDCSEDINECALDESICFNGGTCVNTNGSWYCRCPSEYRGRNCMEHIDLCEVSPCWNGGTCLDYGRRIACLCEPGKYPEGWVASNPVTGFYGDLCEKGCVGGPPESACLDQERIAAEQDYGPNDNESGTEAEIGRRLPAETAAERPCPLPNCVRKAGDGVCDPECDRALPAAKLCAESRRWSLRSGMRPRCPAEAFCANAFRNLKCDPACATEECLFDGFDCLPDGERCELEAFCRERHANGQCDPTCNTAACLYDGGDCINQSDPKPATVREISIFPKFF